MRTPAFPAPRPEDAEVAQAEEHEPLPTGRDSQVRPVALPAGERLDEDVEQWLVRELFEPAQQPMLPLDEADAIALADEDVVEIEVEEDDEAVIEDEDIIGARRVLVLLREID